MTALVQIETRRDITTKFGTIAAREKRYAAPSGDGRWLLFLWLPMSERRGRAVLVPSDWLRQGEARLERAEKQSAAHSEYEHARNFLGLGHDRALQYVSQGLDVSLKTLRLWGYDTSRVESAQRAIREGCDPYEAVS